MKTNQLIQSDSKAEEAKRQIKNFTKSKLAQEKVVIANMKEQPKGSEERAKEFSRLEFVRGEIKGLQYAYKVIDSIRDVDL